MLPVIIVLVYFAIGGVATLMINQKKPAEAKERWTKFFVYMIIVLGMMAMINFGLFLLPAVIIFLIGAYEILLVGRNHYKALRIALVVYAVIGYFFITFSKYSFSEFQLRLYVIVLTFDGFSQIAGQLFGKTKLAPKVSPGKTVEGLFGGAIIAITTSLLIWNAPLQGALICITALAGDLLASFYKRKVGVKDYSNFIPGHGGVLDRFDSFIFTGACFASGII